MPRSTLDQLILNGQSFVYRDRYWTTPAGYRVSTSDGQKLTVAFYAKHGRVPGAPAPASVPKRPTRREAAQPPATR